jgi:hypothetical protein
LLAIPDPLDELNEQQVMWDSGFALLLDESLGLGFVAMVWEMPALGVVSPTELERE